MILIYRCYKIGLSLIDNITFCSLHREDRLPNIMETVELLRASDIPPFLAIKIERRMAPNKTSIEKIRR